MEVKTSHDIPPPYGQVFAHYEHFNEVQSMLFEELLHSDRSVVLSAPTGSGKTVAFELAIVRMFQQQQQQNVPAKAIYVAPMKALCAEKFRDWRIRFAVIGVNCVQITGDTEPGDLGILRAAQLVITTPEKWDSLTLRWRDCREVVDAIRLFMIDEVHLLNEDVRGPILEVIVSRMRTIAAANGAASVGGSILRFVVASATIPNIGDITAWIGGDGGSNAANSANVAQLVYNDSQRPVPLEKHILGFNSCLRGFKFDISLNYKLANVVRKYSDGKPTLIFCNSRKSTEMAAAVLVRDASSHFPLSYQQKSSLAQLARSLLDEKLRNFVAHGIAFHHAGMSHSDRSRIEEHFRKGNLLVLLCTNTLSMGINLPAHLVVVKSTETYQKGTLTEYPESSLLQMIGRAGRPAYDTKGLAVILTHSRFARKYEQLTNGKTPVESHLHKHLAEHLNSEIALNTISSLEMVMNWMRSTFLYVRSVRNPAHYGLDDNPDRDIVEKRLEELCLMHINALQSSGLISKGVMDSLAVCTTNYGMLMVKYYLCFETMKLFRQIRGNESVLEFLTLIARCKEFADFTLRVNEKKTLNELNAYPLRFPIAGRIKTREHKVLCLLQAVLGNITIAAPGLAQESLKVIRIGERVTKCLLEYMRLASAQPGEFQAGCYQALLHSVTIAKCFHAKLWENSVYAVKQLQKIGAVYSELLVNAGKTTLKSIAETDAHTIEQMVNKSHPFGDQVLQNLASFPEYSLQFNLEAVDMLRICVRQCSEAYVFDGAQAVVIVGDSENKLLLFAENLDSILLEYGVFSRNIKIPNTKVEQIYAHIVHTSLVGVDAHAAIVLNPRPLQTKLISRKKANKRKQQPATNCSKVKSLKTLKDDQLSQSISSADAKNISLGLHPFAFSKPILEANTAGTFKSGIEANYMQALRHEKANESKLETVAQNKSVLVQTKVTEYFWKLKSFNKRTLTHSVRSDHNEWATEDENSLVADEETNMVPAATTFKHCAVPPKSAPLLVEISKSRTDKIGNNQCSPCALDLSERTAKPSTQQISVINKSEVTPKNIGSTNEYEYGQQGNKKSVAVALPDALDAIEVVIPLDLSLKSKKFSFDAANASNNENGGNSEMSITYPSQALSSCTPEEEILLFWYTVAQEFGRLRDDAKHLSNFKSIYYDLRHSRRAVDLITTQLHHSTISEMCAPTIKSSVYTKETSKTANSDGLHTNTNSGVLNLSRRPDDVATLQIPTPKQRARALTHQPMQVKPQQQQQKPSPQCKTANPFRLQIFKNDANVAAANLNRATVKNINREVMHLVLSMKCENYMDTCEERETESFCSLEEHLLLNETQNAPAMTFEEYCLQFIDANANVDPASGNEQFQDTK